jgi:flavin reductase (DIM6/NTAB) family NADH-FMN oxidoreductase RutF
MWGASVTTEPFERVAATLDYPMYVVTTVADGERSGCLVGFATQCSIHPVRFLACLSVKNHTYRVAKRAERLAIHVLREGDTATAELFGAATGDDVDKFAQTSWHEGPGGLPILNGAKAWFAGPVLEIVDLGDHHGFVLDPVDGDVGDADPDDLFTFRNARDIEAGHPA